LARKSNAFRILQLSAPTGSIIQGKMLNNFPSIRSHFAPRKNTNRLDSPLERRVYNTNPVLVQVLRKIA
jgi:hypothetical protein